MSEENETPKPAPASHPIGPQTRWQENHGNLLILFVGIIGLLGAGILFYRQHRFIPVRFPESDMIPAPTPVKTPAQDPRELVTIRVTGAANDSGSMMIAIYDSEDTFNSPPNAVLRSSAPIVDGVAMWEIPFDEIPEKIAVAAYHDENNDQQLNRNRLQIPSERYGYSRDARGLTGPPAFDQALINRPAAGQIIELFIR